MSTFRQMDAREALYADRDATTSPGGIRGLKVAEMERVIQYTSRTEAGFLRRTDRAWEAHSKLDKFKTLASVENITKRGDRYTTVRINYTDGTHSYMNDQDLLIIEDPIPSVYQLPKKN